MLFPNQTQILEKTNMCKLKSSIPSILTRRLINPPISKLLIFLPVEVPNVFGIHVVCVVYPVDVLMSTQKFSFGKCDGVLNSVRDKRVLGFCKLYFQVNLFCCTHRFERIFFSFLWLYLGLLSLRTKGVKMLNKYYKNL